MPFIDAKISWNNFERQPENFNKPENQSKAFEILLSHLRQFIFCLLMSFSLLMDEDPYLLLSGPYQQKPFAVSFFSFKCNFYTNCF